MTKEEIAALIDPIATRMLLQSQVIQLLLASNPNAPRIIDGIDEFIAAFAANNPEKKIMIDSLKDERDWIFGPLGRKA